MRFKFSASFFASGLVMVALGGCATPPDRMVGVLGSPAQAKAGTDRKDNTAEAADVLRMPTPAQGDGQVALRVAEDAYARSDWVAAAREFKALTAVYPRNGQVWFGLGAASALSGNLDEASSAFEMALRIDPRDARVAYNLSLIRLSQAEVALGSASANAQTAPAPVQVEIARLSRELGPVFNRSGDGKPVAALPTTGSAGYRLQDPARASAASSAGNAGPYAATPLIPSAAATR